MFKVLFSNNIDISYSQFYIEIEDPDDSLLPSDPSDNQINGLCGAAQKGRLFFTARPKDGAIDLEIQLHEKEPDIEIQYEEIVEVSFTRDKEETFLCEWAHEEEHLLELPRGEYRVRYSVIGLDKDYDYDDMDEDEDEPYKPISGQKYLIQFWPCKFKQDAIIKQTTKEAEYWHNARNK